jgi:hypothetical protein
LTEVSIKKSLLTTCKSIVVWSQSEISYYRTPFSASFLLSAIIVSVFSTRNMSGVNCSFIPGHSTSYVVSTCRRYFKGNKELLQKSFFFNKYGKLDIKKGVTLSLSKFGILEMTCSNYRKERRVLGFLTIRSHFEPTGLQHGVYVVSESSVLRMLSQSALTMKHVKMSVAVTLVSESVLVPRPRWVSWQDISIVVKISIVLSCGAFSDQTASVRKYQQFRVVRFKKISTCDGMQPVDWTALVRKSILVHDPELFNSIPSHPVYVRRIQYNITTVVFWMWHCVAWHVGAVPTLRWILPSAWGRYLIP